MRIIKIYFLLFLAILLSGCATTIKNIDQGFRFQPQEKIGIVIGRVSIRGDKEKVGFDYMRRFLVEIENLDDKKKKYKLEYGPESKWFGTVSQSTTGYYFFLELPEGEYKFSTFPVLLNPPQKINIRFDVKSNKAIYIGHLLIDIFGSKIKAGGLPLLREVYIYEITISDKFNEAITEFKKKYPDSELQNIQRRIMVDHTPKKDD